ncbi:MAG: hypothetical protein OXR66_09310 [Candidatus Woesearchaeota archaeon]|nr:hypothetical protein [Candidatus Woesearchaeota archaeon]
MHRKIENQIIIIIGLSIAGTFIPLLEGRPFSPAIKIFFWCLTTGIGLILTYKNLSS